MLLIQKLCFSISHLLSICEIFESILLETGQDPSEIFTELLDLLKDLDALVEKETLAKQAYHKKQRVQHEKPLKEGPKDREAPIPFDTAKRIPAGSHSSLKEYPICFHQEVIYLRTEQEFKEEKKSVTKMLTKGESKPLVQQLLKGESCQ